MERVITYSAGGCFVGTLLAFWLFKFHANPFLLFLLPMWGMVVGVSIARVQDLRESKKKVMKTSSESV